MHIVHGQCIGHTRKFCCLKICYFIVSFLAWKEHVITGQNSYVVVFTALLQLPINLTKDEKITHTEAVLTQLGWNRCKNSIIGGPFLRGVSGEGQKRVSIGQEMLINPSLLFLDKTMLGLDSTMAQRIVSTL